MYMLRALVSASIIAGSLLGGTASGSTGGRIVFTGTIVEASCPLRQDRLDCPAGRPADAIVRHANANQILGIAAHARLLDYAVHRDPSRAWGLVEVTYR
jgi:type 1 fimbria pilin